MDLWTTGVASSVPQWSAERLLSLTAMWGVMAVAMMVPCIAIRSQVRNVLAQAIMVALGGGLTRWAVSPRVCSAPVPPLRASLWFATVLAIFLLELLKWRRAGATSSALQVICLSLTGGATDLSWMAVVTLWMLVDEMLLEQFGTTKAGRGVLRPLDAWGQRGPRMELTIFSRILPSPHDQRSRHRRSDCPQELVAEVSRP